MGAAVVAFWCWVAGNWGCTRGCEDCQDVLYGEFDDATRGAGGIG